MIVRVAFAAVLWSAVCSGQTLQPLDSVEQPTDGSAAAIQRLNEILQQSPEAASIMRKAASDVAARPYARQAVSTLLSLMQTTHGTDVVMNSLQELMQGAHDGPGLRSLAQSLGLGAEQFSQAAQAMQAIPPYGGDPTKSQSDMGSTAPPPQQAWAPDSVINRESNDAVSV